MMYSSSNNLIFAELSRNSHNYLRYADLNNYCCTLWDMADICHREQRNADRAKVLMLVYYIELCGIDHHPHIDWVLISELKDAIKKSRMNEYQIREMYMEIIRRDTTPRHIMTVKDSLYLLELALDDRETEVNTIIQNFCAHTHSDRQ